MSHESHFLQAMQHFFFQNFGIWISNFEHQISYAELDKYFFELIICLFFPYFIFVNPCPKQIHHIAF